MSVNASYDMPLQMTNWGPGTSVDGYPYTSIIDDLQPYDGATSISQIYTDEVISNLCKERPELCRNVYRYYAETHNKIPGPNITYNALRQLHIEKLAGEYLISTNKTYHLTFVIMADILLLNTMQKSDMHVASFCNKCVYTTSVNDAGGYTNGLYFGQTKFVTKILDRWTYSLRFDNPLHDGRGDYERQLKAAFVHHGIKRNVLRNHQGGTVRFRKMRYNE
eukprot:gene4582-5614_t